MKDLLKAKHKHLLWKDELGASFLLLKHGEIFRYSQGLVAGHYVGSTTSIWIKKYLSPLLKTGVIFDVSDTDDPMTIFKAKIENLPVLINLGGFKKRVHKKGVWLRSMEQALAHKILPYQAALKRDWFSGVPKSKEVCCGTGQGQMYFVRQGVFCRRLFHSRKCRGWRRDFVKMPALQERLLGGIRRIGWEYVIRFYDTTEM